MEAVIDLPNVLERVEDDRDLLRELVELFLEEAPLRLATIRDAVTSRNGKMLQEAAHALKGSAGNLAAGAVYEAAKQLEYFGRDGEWSRSEAAYATLQRELARLTAALVALASPAAA